MESNAAKADLRRRVQEALDALGPAARAAEARRLAAHLEAWDRFSSFEVVLATLPLGVEPDLTPVWARWLASGRRLALARTGPGRSLDFGYVDTLDGPWEPRPYGLREPPRTAPIWTPGPATLCLVPGVAFAPEPGGLWARLGRGAGYYDRWLAANPGVFTLGFGYSVQRVAGVPTEDHDRPLYGWVGPDGVETSADRARIPSQNTEKIS